MPRVAWALASFAPERVDHLVVLSVGHPASFRSEGYEQRQRSWYMLLFQFEGIAERWLSDDDWAHFREWAQHPDADAVIAELEANRSLTPGAQLVPGQRAAGVLPRGPARPAAGAVADHGCVEQRGLRATEGQMTNSAAHVAGPWRYERIERAGHWMQLEAPDAVNRLLLDFLPR